MDVIQEIYEEAIKLEACEIFTGQENYSQLIKLLFSPQGMEFCVKHSFPPLYLFEKFNLSQLEASGVFVNSGQITIRNRKEVMLVGNTDALMIYNNTNHVYKVTLLHGAKANVKCSGYAVVETLGEDLNLDIHAIDNSIVL